MYNKNSKNHYISSLDNYKNKYLKYKNKYLKYKKLIGGSESQILALSTSDLNTFKNLECNEIMNLTKTNRSLNQFIKNNIRDIYYYNNKVDKNFFPKNINNNYQEFVNICILSKLLKNIKKYNPYSFPNINTYDDLILTTKIYNMNDINRFYKFKKFYPQEYIDFLLMTPKNYYIRSFHNFDVKNLILSDDIIDNIIKLLKHNFSFRDAIQYSFISISKSKEEINIFKDQYKSKTITHPKPTITNIESKIKELIDLGITEDIAKELIIQNKLPYFTKKTEMQIKHYSKNGNIDDDFIDSLILLHELKGISLNEKIDISYNTIARSEDDIQKIIRFKSFGLNNDEELLLALEIFNEDEDIPKFNELKKQGLSNYYAILGSKLEVLDLIILLKKNNFDDNYAYDIANNKNIIIEIDDILKLKSSGIMDNIIYKISLFYTKTEQVENIIKLHEHNIHSNINYIIAKNFNYEQINTFLSLISIKKENERDIDDYDNIIDEENSNYLYHEFKDDNYADPYYIYYNAIKILTSTQIILFSELLNSDFSKQIAFLASKTFKNKLQKKMIIDLKEAEINEDDAYEGALVLLTVDQKREYIIRMKEYYNLDIDFDEELDNIRDQIYFNIPPQREPTIYQENPIYIEADLKIKHIFRENLLLKILNPGAGSDYNRIAIRLGYIDEN